MLAFAMTAGYIPALPVRAYEEVTISNLRWDGNIARWDVTGHPSKYEISIDNGSSSFEEYVSDNYYDCSDFLLPGNTYSFKVNYFANGMWYSYSDWSAGKKIEGDMELWILRLLLLI